jgi:hypothetical protein
MADTFLYNGQLFYKIGETPKEVISEQRIMMSGLDVDKFPIGINVTSIFHMGNVMPIRMWLKNDTSYIIYTEESWKNGVAYIKIDVYHDAWLVHMNFTSLIVIVKGATDGRMDTIEYCYQRFYDLQRKKLNVTK